MRKREINHHTVRAESGAFFLVATQNVSKYEGEEDHHYHQYFQYVFGIVDHKLGEGSWSIIRTATVTDNQLEGPIEQKDAQKILKDILRGY